MPHPNPTAHSSTFGFPTTQIQIKKPKELEFSQHSKKELQTIGQTKHYYYFCQNRQDLKFKTMEANFGEYIRKLRTENGLTLTQLGAKLGIDSGALSKIETGKKEFDEKCLDNLANAFNLDIEKLKVEYFGDQFAKKMYAYNCSTETLIVAEEKVNYLKSVNVKQSEIEF